MHNHPTSLGKRERQGAPSHCPPDSVPLLPRQGRSPVTCPPDRVPPFPIISGGFALDQISTRIYTNRKDRRRMGGRNQLLLISSSFPAPFDGLFPWGGNFPAAPCFLRNSSRAFSSAMISATSSAIVRPSPPLPCLSEPLPPSNTSRERPPTSEDPMTPRSSSKSMRRAARE